MPNVSVNVPSILQAIYASMLSQKEVRVYFYVKLFKKYFYFNTKINFKLLREV